jgi:hypothetical protein
MQMSEISIIDFQQNLWNGLALHGTSKFNLWPDAN